MMAKKGMVWKSCIYLLHLEELDAWNFPGGAYLISCVLSHVLWDKEIRMKWRAHSALFCTV